MARSDRAHARRNRRRKRDRAMKGRRRRSERCREPRVQVVRDDEAVFRAAILAGVLSADQGGDAWAGHYMYMFHDGDGTAWFKHRDTRAYLPVSARRLAKAGCPAPGGGLEERAT